jgi:hypothetical protein
MVTTMLYNSHAYFCLQFSSAALLSHGWRGVLFGNLSICRPIEGLQSLRKNGMREVIAGIHGTQILDLELDEGGGQFGLVAEATGETVGLKFKATAQDVHT